MPRDHAPEDAERVRDMPTAEIVYAVPPQEARKAVENDYSQRARPAFLRELGRRHWRELMELDFSLDDLRLMIVEAQKPGGNLFSIHHKHPIHGGGTNDPGNLLLLPHSVHIQIHRRIETDYRPQSLKSGRSDVMRIPMASGMFDLRPGDRLKNMSAEDIRKRIAEKPKTEAEWQEAERAVNGFLLEAAERERLALEARQAKTDAAIATFNEEIRTMTGQQMAARAPKHILTHRILGGSEIIGANAHVFSYGDTRICVDLGMLLTNRDEGAPFDLIVPDFPALAREMGKLDAIVLTHIHQDHIGAIPYLAALGHHLPPIHCEPVTAELLKISLKEMLKQMRDPRAKIVENLLTFRPLKPGRVLTFGEMTVEPVSVAHSAAYTTALVIRAGGVTVLHSADLNAKKDVPVGPGTNFKRLGALAAEGIDAVLLDSTRADTPGTGIDERRVGQELTRILHENKNKRVLVTCFSSSLHRIYSLMAAAAATGRTVVIEGRGIRNMLEACARARMDIRDSIPNGGPNILSGFDPKVADLDPGRALVIMTGCQAEPYAALTMAAQNRHPRMTLGAGDVVVMSSSEIPNNAAAIAAMKDGIRATGAALVTTAQRPVHASGHGHRDDLGAFLDVVKPRYGVPIHGDQAKRAANANLMQDRNIKTLDAGNGTVLTYGLDGAKIVSQVPALWLGISIKSDGTGRTVGLGATPFANDPKSAANDWHTFKQGVAPIKPGVPRVVPRPPSSGRRP